MEPLQPWELQGWSRPSSLDKLKTILHGEPEKKAIQYPS